MVAGKVMGLAVVAVICQVVLAVLHVLRNPQEHRRQEGCKVGLFGSLFKGSDKQTSFLEDADNVLTRAMQTKNTAGLDNYFTRGCLTRLLERIRLSEKAYQGLERYKHVNWKKISDDGTETIYMKTVTYDNVKISKGISAAVGSNYTERWTVVIDKGSPRISEIRRES